MELTEGIQRMRQVAGWQVRPPGEPSSYDILHERVCELYLVDNTFASWWEAVLGRRDLPGFRIEHKLDATGVPPY